MVRRLRYPNAPGFDGVAGMPAPVNLMLVVDTLCVAQIVSDNVDLVAAVIADAIVEVVPRLQPHSRLELRALGGYGGHAVGVAENLEEDVQGVTEQLLNAIDRWWPETS